MGSLRDTATEHGARIAQAAGKRTLPRWIVVAGLVTYCALAWMALWAAGSAIVRAFV